MSRTFLCISAVFFCMSRLCLSNELTREQLIIGVNHVRTQIRSGEMRAIVTTNSSPQKSSQEIQEWIKQQKIIHEESLRRYSGPDKSEIEQQLPKQILWESEIYAQRQEVEESNVAFQIFDDDFVSSPKAYQYKMTVIDRREIDLYSEKAKYIGAGYFNILAYDSHTQILEELLYPQFSFFDSDYYTGFLNFTLHGRSSNYVPVDAKEIGREMIGGVECYLLEFQAEKGDIIRIWVDVHKNFCIRKEEHRKDSQSHPLWKALYKDFQKFGDLWYPMDSHLTRNNNDGTPKYITTIIVKDTTFNVGFPVNFFQASQQFYFNMPGLVSSPFSEITSQIQESDASVIFPRIGPDTFLLTCGPNSLLRICKLLKVNTNFEELAQLSRFQPDRGTTMLGLRDAAKYKGLNPKGIQANIELLKKDKVPMPAIAYVGGNHFLVFEEVVSDGVLISDPAEKYDYHLSFKALSEIWNGQLLIFDYQPDQIKTKPIPLVLTEAGFYDFGEALGGSEIRHTFKLKNIGQKPLKIERVEQSCACTATLVSKDEILPGQFGIVEAVLKVPSENRQVEESINVYTNDPVQNRVTLILKGSAFVPITTFPSRLLLGSIQSKTPITKSLTVHQKGETQILGVRTDSDHLKATVVSAKADQITKVEVALLESAPVGPFSHNLLVGYQYEGKEATHEVMVFGEVLGAFTVSPKRFFFGLVEDKQAVSKTISISSLNDQPFKIASVESNSAYVTTKVASQGAGVGYQLTATVQPEAPAGELSGEILVKTNNIVQPVIRVPFSGIIPSKK